MAFTGSEPVRSKIILSNENIEQANHCNYLGNEVGFKCDRDVKIKSTVQVDKQDVKERERYESQTLQNVSCSDLAMLF